MADDDRIYCEKYRCAQSVKTCRARVKRAQGASNGFYLEAAQFCLGCRVIADIKLTTATRPSNWGAGNQQVVVLPDGRKGKTCSKCHKLMPLEDFAVMTNVSSGRQSRCKRCSMVIESKRRRDRNRRKNEALQN